MAEATSKGTRVQVHAESGTLRPNSAVCGDGDVCLWTGPNFTDSLESYVVDDVGCYPVDFPEGARTVDNQSSRGVTFWSGSGCTGSYFYLDSRSYSSNTPFVVHSFSPDLP